MWLHAFCLCRLCLPIHRLSSTTDWGCVRRGANGEKLKQKITIFAWKCLRPHYEGFIYRKTNYSHAPRGLMRKFRLSLWRNSSSIRPRAKHFGPSREEAKVLTRPDLIYAALHPSASIMKMSTSCNVPTLWVQHFHENKFSALMKR